MPARPLWLCVHEAERHTGGEKNYKKRHQTRLRKELITQLYNCSSCVLQREALIAYHATYVN